MKLSGRIGVTQKTIFVRNEASKSIQKFYAKSKEYHAQNEHASRIRQWKAAQNDGQNDDRTMTIFLVSESLQTHPHKESAKMVSLLARNYYFFIAAAAGRRFWRALISSLSNSKNCISPL